MIKFQVFEMKMCEKHELDAKVEFALQEAALMCLSPAEALAQVHILL